MDTTGQIGENVRKKEKANPFLPDDLISNILSWLPPKNAIRCRLVCRKWRDLTFDPDFVDLQFRRNSIPTILVANPRKYSRLDIFALDKTSLTLHRFPFYAGKFSNKSFTMFSNAGLVVFVETKKDDFSKTIFIILNPTSQENVRITFSEELPKNMICGIYFHPLVKEYCSLWLTELEDPSDHPEPIQYMMFNLGSNPSFKKLHYPFSNRYITLVHGNPLFINNYLYWTLWWPKQGEPFGGSNDILEFDIVSEEFAVIPSLVPLDTAEYRYYPTHIVNIDGILASLLIIPSKITIWRLEDHAEKIWKAVEYTFSIPVSP